jgi:hypothetical protein
VSVSKWSQTRRGSRSASTPASCFFPCDRLSACKKSPNGCSPTPGSRSNSRESSVGVAWPLMARLTSIATGPDRPKCAKSSDPRRDASGFPAGGSTFTPTSCIVTPLKSLTQSAFTVTGTSDGRVFVTVWPNLRAKP